jgi:hypothetical protein
MFWITLAIALIGIVQTRVFWIQAQRLKETIDKMEEISSKQSSDIQASLAQSTKAAEAMQQIADSMASSTDATNVMGGINREIADQQRFIAEVHSRAYLTVVFLDMVPQTETLRFEPRVKIINRGNTPAWNIRFHIKADVQPFPLRDDFHFPLPNDLNGSSSVIGPLMDKMISAVVPKRYPDVEEKQIISGALGQRLIAWGIVKYQDAFGKDRFVKFGFSFFRITETTWLAMDTPTHNESD